MVRKTVFRLPRVVGSRGAHSLIGQKGSDMGDAYYLSGREVADRAAPTLRWVVQDHSPDDRVNLGTVGRHYRVWAAMCRCFNTLKQDRVGFTGNTPASVRTGGATRLIIFLGLYDSGTGRAGGSIFRK